MAKAKNLNQFLVVNLVSFHLKQPLFGADAVSG
jgi:hypothetical protein